MSEQDKEMEAAAGRYLQLASSDMGRSYAEGHFKAGWKAASERKDAEIDRKIEDAMKRAEIDGRLRTYDGAVTELQSKLATALECLEWYATFGRWDGEEMSPAMKKFMGVNAEGAGDASRDRGSRAREAIARIKGDAK
jgi:hypothetical protein